MVKGRPRFDDLLFRRRKSEVEGAYLCLPLFAKSCLEGKAPVLVTNRVDRGSTIDLIFELDDLTIRCGDVSRESDKHLAGYSLLNSNARTRILLAIS